MRFFLIPIALVPPLFNHSVVAYKNELYVTENVFINVLLFNLLKIKTIYR